MNKAIIVNSITKKYKLFSDTRERLLDLVSHKEYGEDFYALNNVSFEAEKGDIVGFIGINGSGKSTLSNIIAGIVPQTTGTVKTNGQVSLIAVASGLRGDLTGRDNIELKLLMLGFNKHEIRELEPSIVEFAELEQFIDQPVKSYSSGMKSRLGFAISVNVNPDILIIDEALSVGDKAFSEKSLNKMKQFKEQGKTMIFVSHSIGQMKEFCEKILWLEFGKVKEYGDVKEVIPKYEDFLKKWKDMSKKEKKAYRNLEFDMDAKLQSNWEDKIGQKRIDEHHPFEDDDYYVEVPISRIGHIKKEESYVYKAPNNKKELKSSNDFKRNVFYIKREAIYKGEHFYLLSHNPSAKEGVIGWVKEPFVSSKSHVAIEEDAKSLHLTGEGFAYSRPWGGKKNIIYHDLSSYKNMVFNVNKTDKVDGKIWYRGLLNGEQVWIYYDRLMESASTD